MADDENDIESVIFDIILFLLDFFSIVIMLTISIIAIYFGFK